MKIARIEHFARLGSRKSKNAHLKRSPDPLICEKFAAPDAFAMRFEGFFFLAVGLGLG